MVKLLFSLCLLMALSPRAFGGCALYNQVQWLDASGNPLSGGLLYSFTAATTSAIPTYNSSSCATPNSNPAVMNAGGFVQAWVNTDLNYKFQIRSAGGVLIITLDGIQLGSGGGGGGGGGGQWTTSGNDIYNTNSGNTGVGTSTPVEKFQVYGNAMLSNGGVLKLRNADVTPYYVGQQAPSSGMAANYTVTWPTALPGMVGCVKMSAAGVLSVDSACSTAPTDTIWSQNVMTKNVTLADGMATVSAVTFRDQTAGTGQTHIVVQIGDGQMSLAPFSVVDSTGLTTLAYFDAAGQFATPQVADANTANYTFGLQSGTGLNLSSAASLRYSSDATWFGAADLCMARLSAGMAWLTDCMGADRDLTLRNITVTGICTGCGGGGSSLPVIDTTSIVKGNVTASKQARFDVETLVSAATTRSLTIQNASYVIAGTNIAQTISGTNTFSSNILALGTPNIGSTTAPFSATFATAVFGEAIKIASPGSLFAAATSLEQITPDVLRMRDAAGNVMQDWTKTVPAFSSLTADFIPSDSTRTLGRTGNRWAKLWVVDIDISGTCTGAGCGGGGGANTALSNLASVAINTNINPDVANSRTSGGTNQWLTTRSNTFISCDASSSNCWQIQSVTSGVNALQFNGPAGNRLSLGGNSSAFLGNSIGTLYPLLIADTGGTPGINFYRSGSFKSGSISSGATAAFSVQDQSDNHRFTVFQAGDVQVGSTTDQGYLFFVNGSARINGSLNVPTQLNLTFASVIAPSGAFGAGTTFNCSTPGQAIKTLTVSGGIVTGATCAAP